MMEQLNLNNKGMKINKHKGYGAILGDMVGVPYERAPIYTKDFDFFNPDNHWSDDTVMTIATMSKLLNDSTYTLEYKWWGNKYYGDYYGANFKEWLKREDWTSNDSFGNGAAMRISPVGYAYRTFQCAYEASLSAQSSHNNLQAIKGAQTIANLIDILHNEDGHRREKKYIEKNAKYAYGKLYPDELKPFEKFKVSCNYTVPVAIKCFVEGTDMEDVIRTAISLGGDTDTIASMAAELQCAFDGGVGLQYEKYVRENIPADMLKVLDEFNEKF